MEYNLYTFPSCDKCVKVKKHLKEKGIQYNEINAGLEREEFNKFYKSNRNKIERDKSGQILLPILSQDNKIIQGFDKILEQI